MELSAVAYADGINGAVIIILEVLPLLMGAFGRYTNIYANLRLDYALLTAKNRSVKRKARGIWKHREQLALKHHDEHGFLAGYLLRNIFPEASNLIEKIERYVLRGDSQHAISFMEAQASSFNMTAVAGAIMAQVAITALSLSGLTNSHWTTEAFFIVSLVCGSLSVFLSCVMHPATQGLHDGDRVRDWLSKPTTSSRKHTLYANLKAAELAVLLPESIASEEPTSQPSLPPPLPTSIPRRLQTDQENHVSLYALLFLSESRNLRLLGRDFTKWLKREPIIPNNDPFHHLSIVKTELSAHRWEVASCYAAMMLVIPNRLLTLSLSYFIIGLGIYLGRLYTKNLIPTYGSGSLGILIMFIATTVLALLGFYIPRAMKNQEVWALDRYEELVHMANDAKLQEYIDDDQETDVQNGTTSLEMPIIPQSVHLRRGSSVSYSVQDSNAEAIRLQPPDVPHEAQEAEVDIYDATPPTARPTGFSYFEPQTPRPKGSGASESRSFDFEAALKDLLKAQQESVDASRRLLELYQSEKRQ